MCDEYKTFPLLKKCRCYGAVPSLYLNYVTSFSKYNLCRFVLNHYLLVQRDSIYRLPHSISAQCQKQPQPWSSKSKSNMTVPALCGPLGRRLSLVWRPSFSVYAEKIHPCHSQSLQFCRSTWWLLTRALRPPSSRLCALSSLWKTVAFD